jgi:hypothetical protein
MCFVKGHNWNDLAPHLKNGTLYISGEHTTRNLLGWEELRDFDFHRTPELIEDLLKEDVE